MTGQLQSAGQLLGLSNVNLPAAYAGDQRSLGALTRVLNAKETGLESPGRRKFMKQTAAAAARQAVPDSVANLVGTTALKKAVSDAVMNPVDGSLEEALSRVSARIATHNKVAEQQAAARAEAGITGMIEGHQPVLKVLRANSGRNYDTGMQDIYALAGKVFPHRLTEEQKRANAAAYNSYMKLVRERNNLFKLNDTGNLVVGSPEAKRLAELRELLYDGPEKPFVKPDIDSIVNTEIREVSPTVLRTGWVDVPELKQKYLPGVGHYVYDPLDNNPWWIKAPDAPLHDDVLIHEFLNSIYKDME